MKIILTRTYYNNDVTFGTLSFDDDETTFVTMERALPKGEQKYRNRCLPEGEHECFVTFNPFEYKGMVVRAPFVGIKAMPYFNGADFLFNVTERPPKHCICVGVGRSGNFKMTTDTDEIIRFFARLSKRYYDPSSDCTTEPVTLVVKNADDIEYEDTSVAQVEKQLAYEKEMMEKAALLDELF